MNLKHSLKQQLLAILTSILPSFHNKSIKNIGISSVVCHDRLDMFIASAGSLMFHLGQSLPIYVVDDGTLSTRDKHRLQHIFTAIIDTIPERERKIKKIFAKFPSVARYRLDPLNPVTKMKLDGHLLTPFYKTIYIDLDVLFLQVPRIIKEWIASPTTNYYCVHPRNIVGAQNRSDEDYSFRRLLNDTKFPLASSSFNTGIVCISNKSTINLHLLDKAFAYFNKIGYSRSFMAEETGMAIALNNKYFQTLPTNKYTCVARDSEYKKIDPNTTQAIHFIGETESRYLRHAILQLIRTWGYRIHPK